MEPFQTKNFKVVVASDAGKASHAILNKDTGVLEYAHPHLSNVISVLPQIQEQFEEVVEEFVKGVAEEAGGVN